MPIVNLDKPVKRNTKIPVKKNYEPTIIKPELFLKNEVETNVVLNDCYHMAAGRIFSTYQNKVSSMVEKLIGMKLRNVRTNTESPAYVRMERGKEMLQEANATPYMSLIYTEKDSPFSTQYDTFHMSTEQGSLLAPTVTLLTAGETQEGRSFFTPHMNNKNIAVNVLYNTKSFLMDIYVVMPSREMANKLAAKWSYIESDGMMYDLANTKVVDGKHVSQPLPIPCTFPNGIVKYLNDVFDISDDTNNDTMLKWLNKHAHLPVLHKKNSSTGKYNYVFEYATTPQYKLSNLEVADVRTKGNKLIGVGVKRSLEFFYNSPISFRFQNLIANPNPEYFVINSGVSSENDYSSALPTRPYELNPEHEHMHKIGYTKLQAQLTDFKMEGSETVFVHKLRETIEHLGIMDFLKFCLDRGYKPSSVMHIKYRRAHPIENQDEDAYVDSIIDTQEDETIVDLSKMEIRDYRIGRNEFAYVVLYVEHGVYNAYTMYINNSNNIGEIDLGSKKISFK
ncbi:MAG: hypothetical protein ACRCX2_12805 [Paraclostridium sp.]